MSGSGPVALAGLLVWVVQRVGAHVPVSRHRLLTSVTVLSESRASYPACENQPCWGAGLAGTCPKPPAPGKGS